VARPRAAGRVIGCGRSRAPAAPFARSISILCDHRAAESSLVANVATRPVVGTIEP
jgi:hypothetical protein